MLGNTSQEVYITSGFECEPPETRTRNLLIKRDGPRMLPNNSKGDLGSNSQKFSPGYYVVYYLIPYGGIKFAGKMSVEYIPY